MAMLNELLDNLEDRDQLGDVDALFEAFCGWAEGTGRPLYPHQEEAFLEILDGHHVIAATPTGSGKSMIALAAHFVSLARGGRSYYTAPLKALVSEKFFDLVALFGATNVGMVTGDVSLNADAPIICCTAEILANQSLRAGAGLDTDMVVMDEFHFYGDPQRGWAWQVPLLELTRPQFVAMSATLGDTTRFQREWEERTHREVALVADAERPVPLEFDYVVDDVHDTVERLLKEGRWPVYIVHFAQRDAVETARSFERSTLLDKERQERVAQALKGVSFGRGFGQTLRTLLLRGIGVHHAGMLPRYRRLVERLTQQGLLAIVCGTDTLGVGINVPIRTVLVTSLVKFDGERMRHLSAREFHQIAGRAGRAGFDQVGFVRVLAPEHEVANARARARLSAAEESARDEREARRAKKKAQKARPKGPKDNTISWTRSTFERLRDAAPEPLQSHFEITHAMVLNVLAGPPERDPAAHLLHLARDNDDPVRESNPHLRRLADIYRSLRQAGVVDHVSSARAAADDRPRLRVVADLPDDFALNQPLSPFALAAVDLLDPDSPTYSLDLVSVVEAVLEDPRPLLMAQQRVARDRAVAAMKAEGMEYDERMAELEHVTWPRPLAELLEPAFATYVRSNPWVGDLEISPKSVVREMVETASTFTELVSRYDVGRSEGVVLRYLTDAYRALRQVLPDRVMTDEVTAVVEWLASLIRSVDSSLLDEWEALADGRVPGVDEGATGSTAQGDELAFGADEDGTVSFTANRHAFRGAIRTATFRRVELMSRDDVEGLGRLDADSGWDADRWDRALGGFWAEHEWMAFDQRARSAQYFELEESPSREDLLRAGASEEEADSVGSGDGGSGDGGSGGRISDVAGSRGGGSGSSRFWLVAQTLVDSESDLDWRLRALVDVPASERTGGVVLRILRLDPRP